jgi:hypothetical protein
MTKRLFLFAGYTPDGILDDSLVLYVRELAALGDVVLCMDSDCDESELKKIARQIKSPNLYTFNSLSSSKHRNKLKIKKEFLEKYNDFQQYYLH